MYNGAVFECLKLTELLWRKLIRVVLSRPILLLIEQGSNSIWSFVVGAAFARWGNLQIFGVFASVMSIYFVVSSAVVSMTIGIVAVDASRLKRARGAYIEHASTMGELLAFPPILIGCAVVIAAIPETQEYSRWTTVSIGCLFVALHVILDVRRRMAAISSSLRWLSLLACGRVFGLLVALSAIATFLSQEMRIYALVFVVLFLSGSLLILLGFTVRRIQPASTRLRNITFSRQLTLGIWLFGSSIAGSAFEQGIAVYSGFIAGSAVVGGWRAGSYLFSFLGILLQLSMLILPDYIQRTLGREPPILRVIRYILACIIVSVLICSAVAFANIEFWLPFLGPQYESYYFVSIWYILIYTAIISRTAVMPFITTKYPGINFGVSLVGNALALIVYFMTGTLDIIQHLCLATAVQATFGAIMSFMIAIWTRRAERGR